MSEIIQKPAITKVIEELDLSGVDFNKYPKGKKIKCDSIEVDDIEISLSIFPHGTNRAAEGVWSASVSVLQSEYEEDEQYEDNRTLIILLKSTLNKAKKIVRTVEGFVDCNAVYTDGFESNKLKSYPYITVECTLHQDTSFVYEKGVQSFRQQLRNIYNASQRQGDIELIIKLNQNENELYVPRAKKQRIDDNNENKNKNLETDKVIKVSSIVLTAASKVFARMLSSSNNMIEYQQKKIVIHAQNVIDVNDMIYFMCTNELRKDCNVLAIIQLAHYYQISRLYWECVNRLIQNVSIDNFVKTISIFDKYEISKGYSTLVQFAKENNMKLKKRNDFLLLSHSFRCGVMGVGNK